MTVAANRLPWWVVPLLAALPVVVLAVFYAWPSVALLRRGLSGDGLGEALGDGLTWRVLWFTTWQAVLSTVVTVLVALAPAYVVGRYDFRGRRLLNGVLVAMFVLPTVVMAAAVRAALPGSLREGLVAIITAHVLFNVAVVVRTVGTSVRALPASSGDAAATLGASPWTTFWTVTVPAVRSAVIAAAGIVFVFTFTSFGVVRILGGVGRSTMEVEIWRAATRQGDLTVAATLTLLQLAVIGLIVAGSSWAQRATAVGGEVETRRRPRRPRRLQWRFVGATAALTAALLVVPFVALGERSLRSTDGYSLTAWRSLGGAEIRPGLRAGVDPLDSLVVSARAMVVATALALLIGAMASIAIVAAGRRGKVLDTVMALPIATSAVTVGLGLLITFSRPPVDWRASWWLVPVGHALVAAPFVVRTIVPVLRAVPSERRAAAATLGASPARAFVDVVLPHLRRPLIASAGIAAAISLGEFGASSFLSRSGEETMPIAIAGLLGRPGAIPQAQGYALATILAAATIVVVVILGRFDEAGSSDDAAVVAGAPTRRHTAAVSDSDPTLATRGASVAATGITVRFAERVILDDVDIALAASEIVGLLGPSGGGKSTLLRSIAGLVDLSAGRVEIDGRDVTAVPTHRRDIGMVFQDNQLFAHLDVAANIAYGLRRKGLDRSAQRRRVDELLELVGLAGTPAIAERSVTTLSGGEAKRVALARSLAPAPRVLLLDEPLTGLDRELHDRLAVDLAAILAATEATVLLVTHDLDEANLIADRVVNLAEL